MLQNIRKPQMHSCKCMKTYLYLLASVFSKYLPKAIELLVAQQTKVHFRINIVAVVVVIVILSTAQCCLLTLHFIQMPSI